MAVLENIKTWLFGKNADNNVPVVLGGSSNNFNSFAGQTNPDVVGAPIPIDGEKNSVTVRNFITYNQAEAIANKCITDADLSNALKNIVNLAVSNETIEYDDSLSDEEAYRITSDLKAKINTIYAGGLAALKQDLLRNAVVYGSACLEIVPDRRLRTIEKVVVVKSSTIEWDYNVRSKTWIPYQRSPRLSGTNMSNGNTDLLRVKLNQNTFKYRVTNKYADTPYGIPPFLSAIQVLQLQECILQNIRETVTNDGLLGLMIAKVAPIPRNPNESYEVYLNRSKTYLQSLQENFKQGYKEGLIVGYQGNLELEMVPTTSNQTVLPQASRIVDEKMMSGIGQDPTLLGRQFSTTETYGKIMLNKFVADIQTYQRAIDDLIAEVFMFELRMQNSKTKYVKITSELSLVNDELVEQAGYEKKINNYIKLYNQGVISQQQLAQALGYDRPAEKEPRQGLVEVKDQTPTRKTENPDEGSGVNEVNAPV